MRLDLSYGSRGLWHTSCRPAAGSGLRQWHLDDWQLWRGLTECLNYLHIVWRPWQNWDDSTIRTLRITKRVTENLIQTARQNMDFADEEDDSFVFPFPTVVNCINWALYIGHQFLQKSSLGHSVIRQWIVDNIACMLAFHRYVPIVIDKYSRSLLWHA